MGRLLGLYRRTRSLPLHPLIATLIWAYYSAYRLIFAPVMPEGAETRIRALQPRAHTARQPSRAISYISISFIFIYGIWLMPTCITLYYSCHAVYCHQQSLRFASHADIPYHCLMIGGCKCAPRATGRVKYARYLATQYDDVYYEADAFSAAH